MKPCGVAKHANKFSPVEHHFYLWGIDSMAFCSPCYSESLVPLAFCEGIHSTTKTIEEWKALFAGYVEIMSEASGVEDINQSHEQLFLKRPKKF